MAGANIKIGANSSEFQKQMKEVTRELKVIQGEFGLASEKANLYGKSTDKLKAQQEELASKLKGQNTIVDMNRQAIQRINEEINKQFNKQKELKDNIKTANDAYEESVRVKGKDHEETKKLKTALEEAKEAYAKNEKAVEASNRKLDNAKIKLYDTEKGILKTKKALEEVNEKLSTIKIDEFSKKLEKVSDITEKTGQAMTTKLTLPILGAGVAASKLASDTEESTNKVNVAFDKSADKVKKWSDTTLDSYGIAKGTALDMAALYGDMGTSMGLSTDAASKMSMSLVGLAGDLASFKNINVKDAESALNGIFTGETESLKTLGVIMTQTNLEQYAYSKGIKKKIEDMTEAEKVQLRYNYVMEKTKNAQGDFIRTGGGAANQARVFGESLKEVGASMGTFILPVITPILKHINDMIKAFGNLDESTKKVILLILGVVAAIGPLLITISKVSLGFSVLLGWISKIKIALVGAEGVSGAFAALTGPIGITIGAIVGLVAIFTVLYKNNEEFRNNVNITCNRIKEIIGAVVEDIKVIISLFVQVAKDIWRKYGNDIVNVATLAFNLIKTVIETSLNIISNLVKIITGVISGDWKKAWEGIKGLIISVWNGINTIVEGGVNFVKATMNTGFTIALDIVRRVFNNIKEAIKSPIKTAADFIGEQVDKIKSFFNGLKIQLPKIKLPHFRLNGEFSLAPPKVPSIGVDWYDKGGVFTGAQIIGVAEKRPEFVGALDDLRYLIGDELDKRMNKVENKPKQTITLNIPVELDGREIARATATFINEELGFISNKHSFAYGRR